MAFVAALLVAIAGGQGGAAISGGIPVFLICAILAFAINWAVFIPSFVHRTERYYDLTGALTYISVILVACLFSASLDARAILVAGMVIIWAVRLGSFLFWRIHAAGKDDRFDKIKQSASRFLVAWSLQGLWVVLTAASALVIITSQQRLALDSFALIGFLIWIAGFGIEVMADRQKSAFRRDTANKDKFISGGLWAWSRHPNYFGEILLWTGITIMSLPLLSGWQWVTIISPLFVTLLLTRVSGIPMLEAKAEKKWGDDPEYRRYRDNTPVLIPMPPRGR